MRFTSFGLVGVLASHLLVACSTYEAEDCWDDCDAEDQHFFARCVANGIEGICQPGHRRCCALETECVGMLDDQRVVPAVSCVEILVDHCARRCTAEDGDAFELCMTEGSDVCEPGDADCCYEARECLGALGRFGRATATVDGCCFTSDECDAGAVCDPMFFTCFTTSGACGDGTMDADEECDDGPEVILDCDYGEPSCTVCNELCHLVPGDPAFCGDGVIDSDDGETCDPPGAACSSLCERMLPAHCTDTRQNVDETDVDCGGPDCDPCLPDEGCRMDRDCTILTPECGATAMCSIATGLGTCIEIFDCDDGMVCTHDVCEAGEGCVSTPIDDDGDGDGPEDLGCGTDCDDTDRNTNPGIGFDLGCGVTDPGFGVDNDCDDLTDEDC